MVQLAAGELQERIASSSLICRLLSAWFVDDSLHQFEKDAGDRLAVEEPVIQLRVCPFAFAWLQFHEGVLKCILVCGNAFESVPRSVQSSFLAMRHRKLGSLVDLLGETADAGHEI